MIVTEQAEVGLMGGWAEYPFLGEVVERPLCRRFRGQAPVSNVLAVAPHRQPRCVTTPGVRPEWGLHHGQDPVARYPHPVAQTVEVVDDLFHRGHDAASRRQSAPHTLEERLGEREVPLTVGCRSMHERNIRCQRREQSERAERRIDLGEPLIGRHGRPGQRPGHHGRQAPGRRFHPLGHGQYRPVLNLDRAGLVGPAEYRVRVVGRKAVA